MSPDIFATTSEIQFLFINSKTVESLRTKWLESSQIDKSERASKLNFLKGFSKLKVWHV